MPEYRQFYINNVEVEMRILKNKWALQQLRAGRAIRGTMLSPAAGCVRSFHSPDLNKTAVGPSPEAVRAWKQSKLTHAETNMFMKILTNMGGHR